MNQLNELYAQYVNILDERNDNLFMAINVINDDSDNFTDAEKVDAVKAAHVQLSAESKFLNTKAIGNFYTPTQIAECEQIISKMKSELESIH